MTSEASPVPVGRATDLNAPPLVARRADAHDVAADMGEIFGDPTPGDDAPKSFRRPPGAGLIRPDRARRLSSVSALVAVGLVGVAGGAWLGRPGAPPKPLQPLTVEIIQPAPPVTAASNPLPTTLATTAPRAAAAPSHHRAAPTRADRRPAGVAAHASRRKAAPDACCTYAQVTDADHRLRRAYSTAIREGVPRPVLATYRDAWAQARSRHIHEPAHLVRRYDELTVALDRATTRARAGHADTQEARWTWRPRYAPWWS